MSQSRFQFSPSVISPFALPMMMLFVLTSHLTSRLLPHPRLITILFPLHSDIHVSPCSPSLVLRLSGFVNCRMVILYFTENIHLQVSTYYVCLSRSGFPLSLRMIFFSSIHWPSNYIMFLFLAAEEYLIM